MPGFERITDPTDGDTGRVTISSLTLAVGDLLELDVGATAWTVATLTTIAFQRKAVVTEVTTTSDTEVDVTYVFPFQKWRVESANTSDVADNGDRMILTDQNTVKNTGTDDANKEAIVIQEGIDNSVDTTTIIVRFANGDGFNPDAT